MYNYKKFDKKSFDETEEDRVSGAWIIFKDFTIKLFPPEFSWEGIDTSEIVAKGRYEKYGEKHITSLSTFLDQFNLQGEAKGKINRKINEILSSNFNNLKIMIDKMGSSYNFKKQARQGLPEMNDPAYDPYKKNKPVDQDGGEGVSYRSSPGSTGFGSDDTNTKGPKGVDIGRGEDSERSEMLDLLSPTDGEDPVKTMEVGSQVAVKVVRDKTMLVLSLGLMIVSLKVPINMMRVLV